MQTLIPSKATFHFSSFFFSVLYIAHSALHRRHSNVPRRLFSGRHWCHIAELSRQHRIFTWFSFPIIKNNNAASISNSSIQVFSAVRKNTQKADQSCDSLRPFLSARVKIMGCRPCVGSSARITVQVYIFGFESRS